MNFHSKQDLHLVLGFSKVLRLRVVWPSDKAALTCVRPDLSQHLCSENILALFFVISAALA